MPEEIANPDTYSPEVQAGVEYSQPKDLKAADETHPLFRQALNREILTPEEIDRGKSIPWNVPATVLKNMSDGLYESPESFMREFESNAETSCLRAQRWDEVRILPEDYSPLIEVYHRADQNLVEIRDNGIGMSAATILDVVRRIGATTVRDEGGLTGMFGMGLASFLKFIGIDNSMILESHSRITDENFAVYVNIAGFDPITGGLPDDEYGVRFSLIYGTDGSDNPVHKADDIRGWVEKYSEWLRVPVHYEEYDTDGRFVMDEDYGGQTFMDRYDDSRMTVTLELEDLLTAATSKNASGVTLLNSMPTERNDGSYRGTKSFNCPYKFDVRIEDESGSIAFLPLEGLGDDELPEGIDDAEELVGLTPVSDAEYNIMDPQERKGHIRESFVPSGCLTLPVPTSSRDSLQKHEEFWERLADELTERFYAEAREVFKSFETVEDILDPNREVLTTALESLNFIKYNDVDSLKKAVSNTFGATLDTHVAAALNELDTDVRLALPGANVSRLTVDDEVQLGDVLARTEEHDGDVYMAVTPNQQAAEVVWGLGRDDDMEYEETVNAVVQLESSQNYIKYSNLFGWKELRDIRMQSLEEYDISDELYTDLMAQMGVDVTGDEPVTVERADPTPPDEEEINLSAGRDTANQEWKLSQEIRRQRRNDEPVMINEDHRYRQAFACDTIILFPTNSERNISEHYWLGGNRGDSTVGLANCNVGTYEYLKGTPGIHHIDTFVETSWNLPVSTHRGPMTIADAGDDLLLHVVQDDAKSHFEQVQQDIPAAFTELCESSLTQYNTMEWDGASADEMYYAPITQTELFELLPAVREAELTVLYGDARDSGVKKTQTIQINRDLWLYARARLIDWGLDTDALQGLISYNFEHDLAGRGYELIENLAYRHDSGLPPVGKA